ncbi:hypothetical protein GCM10009539_06310 [Cryptosporangium japonicum]|uniref:HTH luxR-type domain-containing protein n=1 Tax=Cryptosporangium japonicum TaxID=80872 RepID=A0ABP3D674_9ACTN
MTQVWNSALDGSGRVVTVTGGPASGKTAFFQEFTERAVDHGARFLGAVASQSERTHRFGVTSQLFSAPDCPENVRMRIVPLLQGSGDDVSPQLLYTVCTALLELAKKGPLIIGVDDVLDADPASCQTLVYIARRIRTAPIMLLLSETLIRSPDRSQFTAELTRQSDPHRIRLDPLSPDGVADYLAAKLGSVVTPRFAAAAHALTGGNPLLTEALLLDHGPRADATSPGDVDDRPTGTPLPAVGHAYREALIDCISRYGPEFLRVARAIAAVGDADQVRLLGELADVDTGVVSWVVDALNVSGILDNGRFRHPEGRAAVLRCRTEPSSAAISLRTAELLYRDGAMPAAVTEHLLAAQAPPSDWMVPVLAEAANQALQENQPDLALQQLRLALQADGLSEERRATLHALQARTQWQLDPATSARHLTVLAHDVDAGHLTGNEATVASLLPLWLGRPDAAVAALARCAETFPANRPGLSWETTRLWLSLIYPGARSSVAAIGAGGPEHGAGATWDATVEALSLLHAVTTAGSDDRNAQQADALLGRLRTGTHRTEAVVAALMSLVYADRADRADAWSALYLAESAGNIPPTWRAVLTAVRADIMYRLGQLPTALDLATDALTELSPESWGVLIGLPLSTAVLAASGMGQHHVVRELLRRPVPPAMYETPFGLRYVYARGRHYLNADKPHDALIDLLACGNRAREWEMDVPALVPWRADGAHAYVRLGCRKDAHRLVTEALPSSVPQRSSSYGVLLRALAAGCESERKIGLLTEAVAVLEKTASRMELADALSDLANAHHEARNPSRSAMIKARAERLYEGCRASLERRLVPRRLRDPGAERPPSRLSRLTLQSLSDAEQRVAVLAARGLSNREISAQLHITRSTVEQHLTRVYRKLQIRRRTDLPQLVQHPA